MKYVFALGGACALFAPAVAGMRGAWIGVAVVMLLLGWYSLVKAMDRE